MNHAVAQRLVVEMCREHAASSQGQWRAPQQVAKDGVFVCPGQLTVEHLGGEAAVVQLQIVALVPMPNPWPKEHHVTDSELLVAGQREVRPLSGGDDRELDEAVCMNLDRLSLDVAAGGGKYPFGEVGVTLGNGHRQFGHASGYRRTGSFCANGG
jgi:hypothetical protein